MGLAPIFVEKIFEIIGRDQQAGHADPARRAERADGARVADRGYVLETGRIALADDAKALRENEQVRKTYLGEE